MRRALGLTGGGGNGRTAGPVIQQRPDQARQRHRFAQDGSVAVTVLNHRPDELTAKEARITELQASLENERTQHAATRRTLGEQQSAVQTLQTRLAHMELAHRDALETERRALAVAQTALLAARDAAPRRTRAAAPTHTASEAESEAAPDAELSVSALPTPTTVTADAVTGEAVPAKAKRGRPRIHPPREPKPVRWWTPGYKARTKA